MTSTTKAPPLYPKSHILAASGVAALLSLALLVFPTREVEAKKTFINLELDNGAEYSEQQNDPESANSLSLAPSESPLRAARQTHAKISCKPANLKSLRRPTRYTALFASRMAIRCPRFLPRSA